MTRFDDLFTAGQPADGLEDELRRMLAVREADITEPARPGLDRDLLQLPPHRTHRLSELPGGRAGTLLAAAVVALLVLGSAFAVRGLEHRNSGPAGQPTLSSPIGRPTPSPTSSRTTGIKGCPLPASWASALAGGKIAVDQPQNQPVSAGPDGTFLMLQTATGQTDFSHQELAIFDRNGHGTTIWTAADPAHDYVDVSPDSATSANWVVYGLTRSQNLADHGVVAWNRASGQSTTLRLLSASEEQVAGLVIDVAPIVSGDTAYWIEHTFNKNAQQTLVAQPLPAGTPTTSQVSTVDRLVAIGGGVALLHNPQDTAPGHVSGITQTLTAGPGLSLPSALRNISGLWFGSDGSTLSWLNGPVETALLSWRPGQPGAPSKPVHGAELRARPVGPLLIGGIDDTMLDTRNGSVYREPAGLQFVLTTGTDLIVTNGAGVHRVPLAALPPTRC
jgi:hypothetical protein